ncbi:MAG TPA: OmpA family protein [Chryseosolibacter sp.]|nr:OmpA family protein [Chryseosolibacter sp.]
MRSFIIAAACHSVCFAQDGFIALGKVTDAHTQKGIKADIRYKSIPTGSISGRFNDSTFSFEIFGTARYQITAEAQGYITRTVIVDPKEINSDKQVLKNIELIPSSETIVLEHLLFEQGSPLIDRESYPGLDQVAQMMQANKKMEIQLEGHTDNLGNHAANLELSQKRVDAVKKYLVNKGISRDRIKTKAFGGTRPLTHEASDEARYRNRRVELRILKY